MDATLGIKLEQFNISDIDQYTCLLYVFETGTHIPFKRLFHSVSKFHTDIRILIYLTAICI